MSFNDEKKDDRPVNSIRENGLFGIKGRVKQNRQKRKEAKESLESPTSSNLATTGINSKDVRMSLDISERSQKESEDNVQGEEQTAFLSGGLIQHPMISPLDDMDKPMNSNRPRRVSGPMVPKVSIENAQKQVNDQNLDESDNKLPKPRFPLFSKMKANMKNRALARNGIKEDIALESHERSDGAKQVGYLDIKIRGSKGFKAYNPYMEIHFEGNVTIVKSKGFSEDYKEEGKSKKELEPPVCSKGNNILPLGSDVSLENFDGHWPAESRLHFPITDVTTNIEIFFMDKKLRTFALGKVVIPLPNLYGVIKPNYGGVETIDGHTTKGNEICGTYVCNIMSLASTNPNPAKRVHVQYESLMPLVETAPLPIGQLFLDISVHTEASLLHSYFISRPISKDSFDERSSIEDKNEKKESEEPETDFEARELIIHIFRVKRILREAPLVALLKKYPIVTLGIWYYITMRVYFCNLPFYILSALVINGILAYRQEQKADLTRYPDLVGENVLKAMRTGTIQRIKKMKAMMKSISNLGGVIATGLEKGSNIWNWSDGRITAVTILCSFCLCCIFSIIFHIVSFNVVAFFLGLGIFLKSFKKEGCEAETEAEAEESQNKKGGNKKIRLNQVRERSSHPGLLQSKNNEIGMVVTEDFDTGSYVNNEDEDEDIFGWDAWINPKKVKTNLIQNLISRIPTHFDNVHRSIANNYMKDISNETKGQTSDENPPEEKISESTDKKNN